MKSATSRSLVSGVSREHGGGWFADLRVDQTDPFFYDHPLDHVPGILLVCGLLELVRHALGAEPREPEGSRVRLALRFPAFCEHDQPVVLAASPSSELVNGRWDVSAGQEGNSVCEGWIGRLGRSDAPAPAGSDHGSGTSAIRADLVHRVNPDNIAIGAPDEHGERATVPILAPRPGHFLDDCDGGHHSAEKLLESARQATTMIPLQYGGHPVGSKLLWLSVAADLPHGLPSGIALGLRFVRNCRLESKYRFLFELVNGDGAALGRVASECAVMTGMTYDLLRRTGAGA